MHRDNRTGRWNWRSGSWKIGLGRGKQVNTTAAITALPDTSQGRCSMTQTSSRGLAILLGIGMLPCPGAALALQGCNKVEIAPRSEATVSVLLPDVATDPRPQLTVRNAHKAGPVDNWTACPITKPFGPARLRRTLTWRSSAPGR